MEPDPSDVMLFTKILYETIDNTQIFDWAKMTIIIKFLEQPHVSQYFMSYILNELGIRFKGDSNSFIFLHSLLILQIIAKDYESIIAMKEVPLIKKIADLLLDVSKFTDYDNIRKKILSLFRNWSYIRKISNFTVTEHERYSRIFQKNVPPRICYECEKRQSNIICAECIYLFCNECSMKTLALPHFGFSRQVRVCGDCYNSNNRAKCNIPGSRSDIDYLHKLKKIPPNFHENTTASFLKSMECPICLEILKKPIIICKLGHSMCQNCTLGKLTSCPTCREEITSTRNYTAEDLIQNHGINCMFTVKGCKAIVKLHEKESHETECEFRQVQCEGKKFCNWPCNWVISYNKMSMHFNRNHRQNVLRALNMRRITIFKSSINLEEKFYNIQLVNFCDNTAHFWCKHKIDPVKQNLYWTVQLIGSENTASNYCYEIMIFNGPCRNLKFSEICIDESEDAENIFENKKCAVIPYELLKLFMNEENELSCTLSIRDSLR